MVAWALIHWVLAHNGYVMRFSGLTEVASTRSTLLDSSNTEIARLAAGFTICLWIKFDDVTPTRIQPSLQILHHSDGNFMQPFAGLHEGFQLGGSAPTTLATLGDNITQWHHYAVAWSVSDGRRMIWLDGVLVNSDTLNAGVTWLDKQPFIVVSARGCAAPGETPHADSSNPTRRSWGWRATRRSGCRTRTPRATSSSHCTAASTT
jgi:hypothetical protein